MLATSVLDVLTACTKRPDYVEIFDASLSSVFLSTVGYEGANSSKIAAVYAGEGKLEEMERCIKKCREVYREV